MQTTQIDLESTKLFSSLFTNYIKSWDTLKSYYKYEPSFEGVISATKNWVFNSSHREVLVDAILKQNQNVNLSELSKKNIESLSNDGTFSIATGHQLCLFTGPLYFIIKILSVINYCEELNNKQHDFKYVPVYWMASEDHDFDEINNATIFGKKVIWNKTQSGAVGEMNTETINQALQDFKAILGESENAKKLIQLFEKVYLSYSNYAEATKHLVNELFGNFGLVIVDGNDKNLKKLFKNEIKNELLKQTNFNLVNETNSSLEVLGYKTQVSPREINLFYKIPNSRERIVLENGTYKVLNTEFSFSEKEILEELENNVERFSPNVVTRPLYQQSILPNIAYVGGPGELAYWLQYKKMFEANNIEFPVLVPRKFCLLYDVNSKNKLNKFDIKIEDVFDSEESLKKKIIANEAEAFNLQNDKDAFSTQMDSIKEKIKAIDKSLEGTVDAEKQKLLNSIASLEQKVNKSLKQKFETEINQVLNIKRKLFPEGVPQERVENFASFYLKNSNFIGDLKQAINTGIDNKDYLLIESA